MIVYSDALAPEGAEGRTLAVLCPEGLPRLADLRCLAVMTREGRPQQSAAAFLRWLFSGERPVRLALEAGLIPALPGGEGADELSALLLTLRDGPFFFADGGSDYVKNRAAFEGELRRVLDLLK